MMFGLVLVEEVTVKFQPTFIDLPHDGELQVLPVVLFAVDTEQDSAQLRR